MHQRVIQTFLLSLGCLVCACGDGSAAHGSGKVRLLLTAEATITNGLDVGTDEENTEDFSVRFDKYLAVVGEIELGRKKSSERLRLEDSWIVNMIDTGTEGLELGILRGVPSGTWDEFGFRTPIASARAKTGPNVSQAERDEMIDKGLTYWIEGRVLRAENLGGDVAFTIKASVPTQFSECSYEGEAGLSLVEDGTTTATITLHGDHIFFNAFPAASESSVRRLAAWLVASDLNADGAVDVQELEQVEASDVFTQARGYSLSGAPLAILTAFDFVRVQLASQGHFKGEGECLWDIED